MDRIDFSLTSLSLTFAFFETRYQIPVSIVPAQHLGNSSAVASAVTAYNMASLSQHEAEQQVLSWGFPTVVSITRCQRSPIAYIHHLVLLLSKRPSHDPLHPLLLYNAAGVPSCPCPLRPHFTDPPEPHERAAYHLPLLSPKQERALPAAQTWRFDDSFDPLGRVYGH